MRGRGRFFQFLRPKRSTHRDYIRITVVVVIVIVIIVIVVVIINQTELNFCKFNIENKWAPTPVTPHRRNVCLRHYHIHIRPWPLTCDLEHFFQQFALTWRVFVASFIEIPLSSNEQSRYAKQVLTDGRTDYRKTYCLRLLATEAKNCMKHLTKNVSHKNTDYGTSLYFVNSSRVRWTAYYFVDYVV